MPRVSEFFGITILMHFRDHAPPHFHAEYAGDEVLIVIDTLAVYRGRVRTRALDLITEWASAHQHELRENWDRAMRREPLARIDPLE